ncbi:MAG: hypothetical protein ACYDDA_13285 [Acidiferrobacteraceae bacterium]
MPYRLPGSASPDEHAACATWGAFRGHRVARGWHWKRHRNGCGTFDCPVNVNTSKRWANGWSTREAHAIEAGLGSGCYHITISPPESWFEQSRFKEGRQLTQKPAYKGPARSPADTESYRFLRDQASFIARYVGAKTGALVFHPERCVTMDRTGGHAGAHFHLLTPNVIYPDRVIVQNAATGWVVRGFGFRRTFKVALYELHHAGRYRRVALPNPAILATLPKPRSCYATEAVTWLGGRPPKAPDLERWCPVCKASVPTDEWETLQWVGQGPPPEGKSGESDWFVGRPRKLEGGDRY